MADSPRSVQYTDSMRIFADKFNELVQFAGGIDSANQMLDQFVKEEINRLDLAITNYEIPDNGVTTAKLKDLNVTTPKLNDRAVTEPKLGDGSVTIEKFHETTVQNIGKALKIISYDNFYVNGVTGDDTSDGLTIDTAVKTLAKAGEILSNSRIVSSKLCIQVQAVDASYSAFTLKNVLGNIQLSGYLDVNGLPENDSKVNVTSEGTVLEGISKLSVLNFIFKPTIAGQDTPATIQILAVPSVNVSGVTIDNTINTARTGLYSEYSDIYLKDSILKGCTTALSLSSHTRLVSSNTKFEATAENINLLGNASYLEYLTPVGHVKPTIIDESNSSLDLGLIKSGIMVGQGSNTNGRYIKFADGTMICTHTKQLSVTTTVSSGDWVFPSVFVSDPTTGNPALFITLKTCSSSLDIDLKMLAENHATLPLQQGKVSVKGTVSQTVTIGMMAIGRWK